MLATSGVLRAAGSFARRDRHRRDGTRIDHRVPDARGAAARPSGTLSSRLPPLTRGPRPSQAHPHGAWRAPVPGAAGVELAGPRRRQLRGDERSSGTAAIGARRACADLNADARAAGARAGWDGQGAVAHRRWTSRRGGADALPRRAALAVPLLPVGLPAQLPLLRDRENALSPQPE